MKILIIYMSRFGNTEACARRLADSVRSAGNEAFLYSILEIKPKTVPRSDLYVICSPTQFKRPPLRLLRFIRSLEIGENPPKYAIANTHFEESEVVDRLSKILDEKGLTGAVPAVALPLLGLEGPLEPGFEEKLDAFSDAFLSALS